MKYHVYEVVDEEGNLGQGASGNQCSVGDDEVVSNRPVFPDTCMTIFNTINGLLYEVYVKEIVDYWDTDISENVIFTDGKKCYHWWFEK